MDQVDKAIDKTRLNKGERTDGQTQRKYEIIIIRGWSKLENQIDYEIVYIKWKRVVWWFCYF